LASTVKDFLTNKDIKLLIAAGPAEPNYKLFHSKVQEGL
jgi:hypothetical protein